MIRRLLVACVASLPLLAPDVHADEMASQYHRGWVVRAGLISVEPTDSTAVAPGARIAFGNGQALSATVAYEIDSHLGVELWVVAPHQHDIEFNGMDVASADFMPMTLSVHYAFGPWRGLRPYVGGGVNATTFSNEELNPQAGTADVRLERSWGLAAELGLDYRLGRHGVINAEVRGWKSDSDAFQDGAKVANLDIDPLAYGINIGYAF